MRADEISRNLLTSDSQKVLAGCFEIKNTNDRATLRRVAGEILSKRGQVEAVELGGSLIPNDHWLQLALMKLELSQGETCFCTLYAHSDFYDPVKERDANNISVENFTTNRKTWSTSCICKCNQCGQRFDVHGEGGWHLPWWKWLHATTSKIG